MQGHDLGQDSLLAIVLDYCVTEAHFYFFIDLVTHALEDLFPA